MVDQHTPGSDDGPAGPSASTDAAMSAVHARAGVREAPAFGLTTADPQFDPQGRVTINGFVFVPATPLLGAVRLLTEAAQLFRTYEGHHQDQAAALLREGKDAIGATEAWYEEQAGKVGDRLRKAGVNRGIAERIETFLLTDTTPCDILIGLALSLVQDINQLIEDDGGEPGLGEDQWIGRLGSEGWSSFTRLRDALDEAFPAKAVRVVDPAATVRTIEAAVAGGLIPGMDPEVLSALRQTHDGV